MPPSPVDHRVAALSGDGPMFPARLPISRELCLTTPSGASTSGIPESPVSLASFKVEPSPTAGSISMSAIMNYISHPDALPSPSENFRGSSMHDDGSPQEFELKPHLSDELWTSGRPTTTMTELQNNDSSVSNRSHDPFPPSSNLLTEHENFSSHELPTTFNSCTPDHLAGVSGLTNGRHAEVATSTAVLHRMYCSEKETHEIQSDLLMGTNEAQKPIGDGYNWRKYGQKHIKGSEHPRSYYRCTHPNCEVKKLFERSLDGQITDIVYKGHHNHPKTQPNRKSSAVTITSCQEERYNGISTARGSMFEPLSGSVSDEDVDVGGERPNTGIGIAEHHDLKSKQRQMETAGIDAAMQGNFNREPRVDIQTVSEVDVFDKKVAHEVQYDLLMGANRAEKSIGDGYNWRKYGQKHIKGSECPRSYYRCTHPNCEVKKLFERSLDGKITKIVYKGNHNHPKHRPNRKSSAVTITSGQEETYDDISIAGDMSPNSLHNLCNSIHSGPMLEPFFSMASDEDVEVGGGRPNTGIDTAEDDDLESKQRQMETAGSCAVMLGKLNCEPRIVIQDVSEVDVLDDGYRWRKYGQKVMKGNPNPRSYYKCTSTGCAVRKHVERASHDPKSVVTAYVGEHDHEVPSSRNATASHET